MRFRIRSDDGSKLDAAVELEPAAITMFSRGGTSGTRNSQNQDYPQALRLLLGRLHAAGRAITGAWVDSLPARQLARDDRQILFADDMSRDPDALFSLMGRRMEAVGRAPMTPASKGNRNKRLRIEVATTSIGELASVIDAAADADVPRSSLRLPAADLRRVTEGHVWSAIEQIRGGAATHAFDESQDYDLITDDGTALPPKAVFGLAASLALGYRVQPVNFTGGLGTTCFDILEAAGWQIVSKDARAPAEATVLDPEAAAWAEGDARRITHLRRERHPGVARAKKAQMRELHGRLFCEDCRMDPLDVFGGPEGEACIEVHHRDTEVAQMAPGHFTKLSELECLCANCHRVRHRRIRDAQKTVVTSRADTVSP